MTSITIKSLRKVFPDGTVGLHDLSLDIADREFLTFLGPSGCGKTTTLRMVAGLEHPTSGEIFFGERRVDTLTPAERNIAMVFQSYALYPHMTVRENLEYPLKKRKLPKADREARIARAAKVLKIEELLNWRPRQLSGGQQQRVALGRAIVKDTSAFLLDEPLSNLDAELRAHMRTELIQLHKALGCTMLYVTHDQIEAMTMSTRIAVLSHGKLQQIASPDEIYRAPANQFVATFVGSPAMNFIEGRLVAEGERLFHQSAYMKIELPRSRRVKIDHCASSDALAGFRSEDVSLEFNANGDGNARVVIVERAGHEALVWLEAGDKKLVARTGADTILSSGDAVKVVPRGDRIHLFASGTGFRIGGDM